MSLNCLRRNARCFGTYESVLHHCNFVLMFKKVVSSAHKTQFSVCLGTSSGINADVNEVTRRSMTVWFNHQTISHVLSYMLLSESRRVTVDSVPHDSMLYFIEGEGWINFDKLGCGICALDCFNPTIPNKPAFYRDHWFKQRWVPKNITPFTN